MMKKLLIAGAALCAALTLSVSAFAAGAARSTAAPAAQTAASTAVNAAAPCTGFTDADGDGVCDNAAPHTGSCPGYAAGSTCGTGSAHHGAANGTGRHHG